MSYETIQTQICSKNVMNKKYLLHPCLIKKKESAYDNIQNMYESNDFKGKKQQVWKYIFIIPFTGK